MNDSIPRAVGCAADVWPVRLWRGLAGGLVAVVAVVPAVPAPPPPSERTVKSTRPSTRARARQTTSAIQDGRPRLRPWTVVVVTTRSVGGATGSTAPSTLVCGAACAGAASGPASGTVRAGGAVGRPAGPARKSRTCAIDHRREGSLSIVASSNGDNQP